MSESSLIKKSIASYLTSNENKKSSTDKISSSYSMYFIDCSKWTKFSFESPSTLRFTLASSEIKALCSSLNKSKGNSFYAYVPNKSSSIFKKYFLDKSDQNSSSGVSSTKIEKTSDSLSVIDLDVIDVNSFFKKSIELGFYCTLKINSSGENQNVQIGSKKSEFSKLQKYLSDQGFENSDYSII